MVTMMTPKRILDHTLGMKNHASLGVYFKKIGRNEKQKDQYQVIEDYIRKSEHPNQALDS